METLGVNNTKQTVIFCYSIGNPWIGSTKMRVRQIVKQLKTQLNPDLYNLEIRPIERIRPWKKNAIIIATKPNSLKFLKFLSARNTIILDQLDNHPKFYPRRQNTFEFIAATKTQELILGKIYGPRLIKYIPHHFDPILFTSDIRIVPNTISYVGNVHKTSAPKSAQIEWQTWSAFIEKMISGQFHWTIRKREYLFEPETKIATAAAAGAIAIVNSETLGGLIPYDYPFHLPHDWNIKDEEKLIHNMNCPIKIEQALKSMQRVSKQCSIKQSAVSYAQLIRSKTK